ncbi:MFS transporter [Chloroflexota bacterium]
MPGRPVIRVSEIFTLGIILFAAACVIMTSGMIVPVLNQIGPGLGVGATAARWVVSAPTIMVAILSPFFGSLIDRIGPKRPLIFGLLVFGLAGGAGFFITSYWLMIASRVVFGIGMAAIALSITIFIFNLYQGPFRNTVMGWQHSGSSAGVVLWPVLSGYLGTYSWNAPFAVYFIGILLAVAGLVVLPDARATTGEPASAPTASGTSYFGIFRQMPLLFLPYALMLFGWVVSYGTILFAPALLVKLGTVNTFHIGLLVSLSGVSSGIMSIIYGKTRARLSNQTILSLAMIIWIVALLLMFQAGATWVAALGMSLFGFGMGAFMPALTIWVGEMAPANIRGRATSFLITSMYLGQFLSPLFLNPAESAWGMQPVFVVMAAITGGIFLTLLVFRWRK